MDQAILYINIKDLVLWTENPRDRIDETATDQDIVDKALNDKFNKWSLKKLAKKMGAYYDYSELPTIVYHSNKPVVYDGNRRMVLGKIKHKLVHITNRVEISIPDFPSEIPCNVCSEEIALKNVYRKHSGTGSWLPLERDLFLHKYMNEKKSIFLLLEEKTGIISANPHLNQGFVRKEVLNEDNLKRMGFSFLDDGRLLSIHNDQESHCILSDISQKVEKKEITTRKKRGNVVEVLEPSSQSMIANNEKNKPCNSCVTFKQSENISHSETKRQSRRTSQKTAQLFGGTLYLRSGDVSDLYRDIVDLHKFYIKEKKRLSQTFPTLIRMSLRLLCEIAAKDHSLKLDNYCKDNFSKAIQKLDKDTKTTLSNQNVTAVSIVQLLHTGAHDYSSSTNMDQTLALSVIVGEILMLTHGQDN